MYKGIILAGGSGTRLHPSSLVVSKQLMNVYDKPLVYYPLCTLMIAGIKDILIITNENQVDQFERLLGDGSHLGVNISYKVQDNPNGLPEAFVIAEDFIGDDNVCMVLGDNIIFGNNLDSILKESQRESGATILSYPVRDPERFGVIEFEKYDEGNVVSIEEKPEHPKSNRALIGIYFFDNRCIEYAKQLKPSKRGETEIIDLCKKYLEDDELNVKNLTRTMTWIDAGTFESLLLASNFVSNFEKIQSYKISCPEEVAYKNRWIDGKQLLKLSESYPKSGYGDYLAGIIEDY
jgi:glucose-1-phosphate thymidylyltransferase